MKGVSTVTPAAEMNRAIAIVMRIVYLPHGQHAATLVITGHRVAGRCFSVTFVDGVALHDGVLLSTWG